MEEGELQTIIGAFIIIISLILTFIFKFTYKSISRLPVSIIVFLGAIIGGSFLIYVLTTTEVKWARIVSKLFFIIPILTAVGFLSFWGITTSYNASKNSFIGYSQFLPWVFIWGILILIYALEILLFIKIDKTKNSFLKALTWIVGISIYFVTGVIGAIIVSPPFFGTYGTPMYKPKIK